MSRKNHSAEAIIIELGAAEVVIAGVGMGAGDAAACGRDVLQLRQGTSDARPAPQSHWTLS